MFRDARFYTVNNRRAYVLATVELEHGARSRQRGDLRLMARLACRQEASGSRATVVIDNEMSRLRSSKSTGCRNQNMIMRPLLWLTSLT